VQRILNEEPSVAQAVDDWQFITSLRAWAYRNIRRQADHSTLLDVRPELKFYSLDAPDVFEAFSNDLGGVIGGGCTYSLLALYEAFGFEALMLDCGVSGKYTRISTVCNISRTSDPFWAVQDPNYDFALANAAGGPIDIREVIRLLGARRHAGLLRFDGPVDACREEILRPGDTEWTVDPSAEPIRVLTDGRAVFRAHMTMARYVEQAVGPKMFLLEQGLPDDLLYFYFLAFAVYPASSSLAGPLFEEIASIQLASR
jgi:hypothetical protein